MRLRTMSALIQKMTLFLVVALVGLAISIRPAQAQVFYEENKEPVEIPLIFDFGVGARAMGMGGAHVAVVEDASAIYYNPAGLAMIRRIEIGLSLTHQDDQLDVTHRGELRRSSVSSTKLHQVALAYPVPTYRGSLVLGFAYHRPVSLDRDYYRVGPTATGPWEYESMTDRGGLSMYSIGAAFDASPHISLGGSLSLLGGSWDTDYYVEWDEGVGGKYWYRDEADIDGVTGSLGMLYKFEPMGRIGLAVDFPRKMTIDGTKFDEDYPDGIATKDEITLPFSFSGGVAFTLSNFVFALDLRFTDWSQIDYEGPVRVEDGERRKFDVYENSTQVRLGAEFLVPNFPIRLRGGYLYDPVPYKLMFTDDHYFGSDIVDDRDFFTVGAGVILEKAFSLDVAFMTGGFKRSAVETTEDLSQNRVFVSAGYRY